MLILLVMTKKQQHCWSKTISSDVFLPRRLAAFSTVFWMTESSIRLIILLIKVLSAVLFSANCFSTGFLPFSIVELIFFSNVTRYFTLTFSISFFVLKNSARKLTERIITLKNYIMNKISYSFSFHSEGFWFVLVRVTYFCQRKFCHIYFIKMYQNVSKL